MNGPLRIVLIEDEMILVMQLEDMIEEAGHRVVAVAGSSREAARLLPVEADLALVDIHLADGPTGVEIGRSLSDHMAVVFMTANPTRLPDDLSGAVGVIAKPYTHYDVHKVLEYMVEGITSPPPRQRVPNNLTLGPRFKTQWLPPTIGATGLSPMYLP